VITGLLLYAIGLWVRPPLALAAAACIALGLVRACWPAAVPIGGFLVPRHWEKWGQTRFVSVFGLLLGMAFVTTLPSLTLIALGLAVWYLHAIWIAVAVLGSFAAGRLAATLGITGVNTRRLRSVSQEHVSQSADRLLHGMRGVGMAEAALFILAGIAFLIW